MGLPIVTDIGLEKKPNPSMLMESHVISNKWAVRGMGVLGLPMMALDLGLSWSTRPKLLMKMDVLGLPMVRTLGLSKSPGPSMLVESLMLPMLATLMAQVHVELAHLATSFLNKF